MDILLSIYIYYTIIKKDRKRFFAIFSFFLRLTIFIDRHCLKNGRTISSAKSSEVHRNPESRFSSASQVLIRPGRIRDFLTVRSFLPTRSNQNRVLAFFLGSSSNRIDPWIILEPSAAIASISRIHIPSGIAFSNSSMNLLIRGRLRIEPAASRFRRATSLISSARLRRRRSGSPVRPREKDPTSESAVGKPG